MAASETERGAGLWPEETVAAYRTIYFPAQEIHFERDDPKASAHLLLSNDEALTPEPEVRLR